MPWDLYWGGPISAFFYYAEAHGERVKSDQNLLNQQAFITGMYTVDALKSCYKLYNPFASKGKNEPYPKEPRKVFKEPEKKQDAQERRKNAQMKVFTSLQAWSDAVSRKMKGGER